jgi:DMSO reductase anchor subunit
LQHNLLYRVLYATKTVSMSLAVFTLMVNASLMVLIWIVQLVVYPGFNYSSEADIKRWHPLYTVKITYIVLPLMVSQLGVCIYSVVHIASWQNLLLLALVVATWGVTFVVSVPLHAAIDRVADSTQARKKLVQTNWIRTIIWTLILVLSILFL